MDVLDNTHFPLGHRSHITTSNPEPFPSASLGTPDKASRDLCPDTLAVLSWQNMQLSRHLSEREMDNIAIGDR